MGLGVAAIGVAPLETLAAPVPGLFRDGMPGGPIRLRSNENPYGPSPMAKTAIANVANITNRYNWELPSELITTLAQKYRINNDNILLAAGSTELLDLTARFAALQEGSFLMANPTYDYWTVVAERLGLKKIAVPVMANKQYDLPAMLNAIRSDTRLIYLCNPNNPTGAICNRDALVKFIQEATQKTLVLVDEAYIDFTDQPSLCDLAIENKNLVVVKTFSKIYGLAGARVGYALAHADTIVQLSQLQSWPNGAISVISTAAALASLKDTTFVNDTRTLIEKAKKYTTSQFERLKIPYIPSSSNFLYFSLANYKKDFFAQLKSNNILGTRIYEEQGRWSRITVGTMQEMERFINAID